jgi:hypothetical protein
MIALATSANTMWGISLGIGLVAALIAASLLALLVLTVMRIDGSVKALLGVAVQVAGNTEHIPELTATAPALSLIVEELHVQDDYMNALTDGFGGTAA